MNVTKWLRIMTRNYSTLFALSGTFYLNFKIFSFPLFFLQRIVEYVNYIRELAWCASVRMATLIKLNCNL